MITSVKNIFSGNEEEEVDFYEEENEGKTLLKSNEKVRAIIEIFEPSSFRQSNKILDEIEKGKAVVVKTSKLDQSEAQRLIDILNGALYSLKGEIVELAPNTYLCVPIHIRVEETSIIGE